MASRIDIIGQNGNTGDHYPRQRKYYKGRPVIVIPDRPKIQLQTFVPTTPKFRKQFNKWLKNFFGHYNPMHDGQIWEEGHAVCMNPRTLARIEKEGYHA